MILKTSKEILEKYVLCNNCLGRQFGKISISTNQRRGEVIRNLLKSIYPELSSDLKQERPCFLCDNIFERTEGVVRNISPDFEFFTFHAGTKIIDSKLVTSGGRVLGITGIANSLESAIIKTYDYINNINFENMHFRKDIAKKGLKYEKV
ncbi:MAG: hypothetical protein GKC00_00760 [Candidatus Methanofastidiosa archaeon]|nr:hypothetical protein [Candidatus Methanofastidiosa archaeon]